MPKNDLSQIKWGDGTNSSVGEQLRKDYYKKQALIEAVKEQYFQPMADATAMPKHYGKTIKQYHFLPLLDDRNVNDQGIDAKGATIADGNMYGSSKDIGTITSKLPLLSETGGRVNRVGYQRIVLQAELENLGFFHEFTDEALAFDTMDDLYQHLSRELVNGASEMTEDVLQIDLLNGAGVLRYGGEASSRATMAARSAADADVMDYGQLQRLSIDLDNNRVPKQKKILTGSTLNSTVTVGAGRVLFIGSELIPTFTKMVDYHGAPAFIDVSQYAYSGDYKKGVDMIHGEIGKVGQFRIVVVPEMQHWAGEGADSSADDFGYRSTGNKWDVFPMLCIGEGSFTTIGFQTGGKSFKFKILTKMPGEGVASKDDPYGRTGFSSIQWYYGTMILRPERLAVAHSLAEI